MTATLPVKISFSLPDGWRSAPPDEVGAPDAAFVALHPASIDGFTANITIAGGMRNDSATMRQIADESVRRLGQAGAVEVTKQEEVGTPDIPGLTDAPGVVQNLRLATTLHGEPLELVQSQVYLGLEDVDRPSQRAVIELVLTAKPEQLAEVLDDFKQFVRSVRADERS
ncbi:hypothetical protein GCM10018980_26670 [Streptomyces capoamus]|uniref:DUF1795 domain-containing protein n=1 Tax=Streptomyces capoamus TaxID=68183 RepID=A0A919C4V1_9ACTN|nr:hypothetical protein [Streptomyces capoamus]GGW19988.1 hypothetical protein GCM10010501_61440 [Streptomyces libani subsp. rufus]GHG47174.1 hypothetical protein GCM10018980_26670 [Streptomyces capoamus]